MAYNLITRGALVACCDIDAERREAFAAEFGIRGYGDAVEMIRAEQPDLIHLVTAPSLRVELMTIVHEQGVPLCLVEKPIATEVRDWRALVALEARSETRYGVNAQFRYHPDLTRCRQALASGRLGEVLFLDASAGGTICDQGVHVLDWAMSLIGDVPVVCVFGTASGAENMTHHMHPSPDTTLAQVLFANGVRGLWHLGHTAPRVTESEAYYQHCRVAAYAERGRTLYEEFGRWEIVSPEGFEGGRIADQADWLARNHQAQANLTNAMFDWLEDGNRPPGTNLRRSLAQWNVILGLYASALWRRPVETPFDPPDDLFDRLDEALQPL
jgi:predicted dehydrogenase